MTAWTRTDDRDATVTFAYNTDQRGPATLTGLADWAEQVMN